MIPLRRGQIPPVYQQEVITRLQHFRNTEFYSNRQARLFVSSANFTETTQQKNLDVGLLLHSTNIADRLL